jgi:hypothetical protein
MGQLAAIGRVGPKRGIGDEPGELLTAAADVDIVDLSTQIGRNGNVVPDAGFVREDDVAVVYRAIPRID